MKEKLIYKGNIFTLVHKDVQIHGQSFPRDIIHHPGGVGIVVIVDHKILIVRQYRHAIEKESIEIPAGKLEYGEDPVQCAMRELNEETGYDCDKLEFIQSFVTTPGFCDEKIWLFEAVHPFLAKNRLAPDADEDIRKEWMDLDEAYQYVRSGVIDDAKSVIAIQYAALKERR